MVIALIAVSRVYLLAHWPSDVLAGVLFGGSLVFAMAFLLHGRPIKLPYGKLAGIIGAVLVTVYPLHLYSSYAAASTQYATTIPPVVLDRQQWQETDWQELPPARILLGGDSGEPTLIQTDLPLADILKSLTSSGWQLRASSRLDELLGSIIPSKGLLSAHLPRPLTNNGKSPVATMVRPNAVFGDKRVVLRVWETGFVATDGHRSSPILLMSATAETLNPILLDFSLVEAVRIGRADLRKLSSDVVDALPGQSFIKALDRPIHLITSRAP